MGREAPADRSGRPEDVERRTGERRRDERLVSPHPRQGPRRREGSRARSEEEGAGDHRAPRQGRRLREAREAAVRRREHAGQRRRVHARASEGAPTGIERRIRRARAGEDHGPTRAHEGRLPRRPEGPCIRRRDRARLPQGEGARSREEARRGSPRAPVRRYSITPRHRGGCGGRAR